MKKLMFAMLAVMALSGLAYCADSVAYTQDVSSFGITNADRLQFVPLISSSTAKTYISRIQITRSDITVAQKVTLYQNCNSTTTASALWSVYLASGATLALPPADFTDANPLLATRGVVVRKSDPACSVQVNILTIPAK